MCVVRPSIASFHHKILDAFATQMHIAAPSVTEPPVQPVPRLLLTRLVHSTSVLLRCVPDSLFLSFFDAYLCIEYSLLLARQSVLQVCLLFAASAASSPERVGPLLIRMSPLLLTLAVDEEQAEETDLRSIALLALQHCVQHCGLVYVMPMLEPALPVVRLSDVAIVCVCLSSRCSFFFFVFFVLLVC